MQLQGFIIGLMAFVLFSIVTLTFVFDVYDTDNLNVSLDDSATNNVTYRLYTMQQKVSSYQSNLTTSQQYMEDRVPGGSEADLPTGEMTEAQLAKASLTAITKIPTYLGIFGSMLLSIFSIVGIGGMDFIWFFGGAIIVIVILLLIGSVLRNRL